MKQIFIAAIAVTVFFLLGADADAQRYYGGYYSYRPHPVYRARPRIMVGIGGGYYGWGPRVGVNIGVVLPPPGAVIRTLPPGAVERTYGGITYYYRNNTYYREREDGGYEIVAPPLGASVSRLPLGAKLRKIDGKYYYEYNGTFYLMEKDERGNTVYIIAGKNGELNTDEADAMRYENSNEYTDDTPDKAPPVASDDEHAEDERNNISPAEGYPVLPQVGDRFEQLPRNSRQVMINGSKQYISPNGVYYKEVTEQGHTMYEVVKTK